MDCAAQWDCSNVEWTPCVDGIATRDLTQCQIQPSDAECFNEENIPSSSQSCKQEAPVSPKETTTKQTVTEEVPIFTWINILCIMGLLTAYYAWKKY